MDRAGRARRLAAAAAFGGGGLGLLGATAYGVLATEVKWARKLIGQPFGSRGPGGDAEFGAVTGEPLVLAMMGDSTSVGLGADHAAETPGAVLAGGLAALSGRRVVLREVGRVGGRSAELDGQVERLLSEGLRPSVAVVMVGANDVTKRVRPAIAVRALEHAVRTLREAGVEVVVGTCPDLGTIEPIGYPLRYLARRWSRQLAAAQTIAVIEAGARTVSLGDLLGPEFAARPSELFSSDRFHPSAAGYARVAAAILPSVAASLGCWPHEVRPDVHRGEGVDDVANAAVRAVETAGTEISPAEVSGELRGPRGRWVLLRRRRSVVPAAALPDDAPSGTAAPGSGNAVVSATSGGSGDGAGPG